MKKQEIIKKITKKKEYSQLPGKDVERVFEKFDKSHFSDEEKIKMIRKFLMENYSGFGSKKLLTKRERKAEWILKKHLSTRERYKHYKEIYERILKGFSKNIGVIDLGCGVNGFSYPFFLEAGLNPDYIGVEAIGQFVEKTNNFFEENKHKGRVVHETLLHLEKIKEIVKKTKKPRVVLMFKVVDSLESLERNYSKELILELKDFVERFVVSFPTKSMVKREQIWVKRTWFLNFVKNYFSLSDDFEIGDERYFVFRNK